MLTQGLENYLFSKNFVLLCINEIKLFTVWGFNNVKRDNQRYYVNLEIKLTEWVDSIQDTYNPVTKKCSKSFQKWQELVYQI